MPASIVSYGGVSMDEAEAIAPGLKASQTPISSAPAPAAETIQEYAQTAVADINAGNYAGAWQDALASESDYGGKQSVNTAATDPLIAYMESGQGLKALDPTLSMSASQIQQYYDAFSSATGTNAKSGDGTGFNGNLAGKNPYGLWGTAADTTAGVNAQAALNAKNEPGIADIQNYLGARPTKSFLSKYGADIAALAATIVTWGAASPLLAAAVGAGAEIAGNAAEGNATTLGSIGKDLATAAIGAAVPGFGAELGATTGVGATLGTAAVGAAGGALNSEILGGNVELGAALGGVAGAVRGSNITGTVSGDLQGEGLGAGASNLISKVGVGLATGAVDQEIGSALGGAGTTQQPRAVSSTTTTPQTGAGEQDTTLSTGVPPPATPPVPATNTGGGFEDNVEITQSNPGSV
jgi:hypothetical protein